MIFLLKETEKLMYFAVFSSKHSKLFSSKIFDRCFITSRKLFPESLWTCLLNPLSEMWKIFEFNYGSNSRVNGLNFFLRNLLFFTEFFVSMLQTLPDNLHHDNKTFHLCYHHHKHIQMISQNYKMHVCLLPS